MGCNNSKSGKRQFNKRACDSQIFKDLTPTRKNRKQNLSTDTAETASSDDMKLFYNIGKVIGNGQFGKVRLATLHRENTRQFAVKSIAKIKMGEKFYMLRRELEILKTLDHPNIVKFYETYQDDTHLYFVMEYCSGGDLYNKVIKNGPMKEEEAKFIAHQIFSAVAHMHRSDVAHRDLKSENILFSSQKKDSEVKIIDFGLSRVFRDEHLDSLVGTPLYVAPEIIEQKKYGKECDCWSLGVITYLLLCGHEPFVSSNVKEVYQKIINVIYNFNDKPWQNVSKDARDLISKLLVKDQQKRYTVEQALKHPWFNDFQQSSPSPLKLAQHNTRLNLENLMKNHSKHKFRKYCLKILVNQWLAEEELQQLMSAFKLMDSDNNGELSLDEMKQAMEMIGMKDQVNQMKDVYEKFNQGDKLTDSGQQKKKELIICYSDFLSNAINLNKYLSEDKLNKLFSYIDADSCGFITYDDIKQVLAREGKRCTQKEIQEMVDETDLSQLGKISFEDFKKMMYGTSCQRLPSADAIIESN